MQKPYSNLKESTKEMVELPLPWIKLIRYCENMGFGELQRVLIQDGVPVLAEKATEKIKFN